MKQQQFTWGPRTISFWMAALISLGITFIGIRYALQPLKASIAFGLSLPDGPTALYGSIKGIRDVFSGLTLAYLLYSRNVRATAFIFMFATCIPIVDASVVYQAHGFSNMPAFLIHSCTALYGIINSMLLFRDSKR
ncbi:DUF4267 domain-containing protein [Olivibacter ginsenosidimutans]|uniref:DUF4267 domain-containing protein n=1 Tax=Olivibacter ginsenosidimutans TaxID=1176537 RepID=A0ABP9BXS1_9SPHI